jgi:putative transposase
MGWRRHSPDEIFAKLERAEALLRRGASAAIIAQSISVTEATYFRWRRRFGVLKQEQLRRFIQLELENARLRRAIEELERADVEASAPRRRKSAKVLQYRTSEQGH